MLIKQADDQSKRLALLESLQNVPTLDRRQRDWLSDQLWALRMGMSGERNAAHYIDHYYKESPNLAVLHDLRLELDDEVAQIDHLIISRGFLFYLLETKNFSGNLSINEHGEFTVHYGSGSRGIPSPLEQSKRHEKALSTRPVEVKAVAPEQSDSRKRKLVCCTCDAKITFEEGKFCWNNESRFGGLQYCGMHQADYL